MIFYLYLIGIIHKIWTVEVCKMLILLKLSFPVHNENLKIFTFKLFKQKRFYFIF